MSDFQKPNIRNCRHGIALYLRCADCEELSPASDLYHAVCTAREAAHLAHIEKLETFICEFGGLPNEWAKTWDPNKMTLRDHTKTNLDQWLNNR